MLILLILYYITILIMILALLATIFIFCSKISKEEESLARSFECGFSSFKRINFSIATPFLITALIFLILDLELCFILVFFNEEIWRYKAKLLITEFIYVLLRGLLAEWKEGQLE